MLIIVLCERNIFIGLGMEGLRLLGEMRDKYDLNIITEVKDATHVDAVIEHSDIIQIGAKAMYDHGILKKCGETDKPVLLKRGFGHPDLAWYLVDANHLLEQGLDFLLAYFSSI